MSEPLKETTQHTQREKRRAESRESMWVEALLALVTVGVQIQSKVEKSKGICVRERESGGKGKSREREVWL